MWIARKSHVGNIIAIQLWGREPHQHGEAQIGISPVLDVGCRKEKFLIKKKQTVIEDRDSQAVHKQDRAEAASYT